MAIINTNIDDELDKKFRKAVVEKKGMRKGVLGEAIQEAMNLWIESYEKDGQPNNRYFRDWKPDK